MLKLIEGTAKVSKDRQGALVEMGILEKDRKYNAVALMDTSKDSAVNAKVHELMADALEGIISQICSDAPYSGSTNHMDWEFVRAGIMNNIHDFNLLAGSGFSEARKAQIIEEKYDSLVDLGIENPTVDLFLPVKTGGTTSKAEETTGTIDL